MNNTKLDPKPFKKNQRGASTLAWLVFLGFFAYICYQGSKVGSIFYGYFSIHSEMLALAGAAGDKTDTEIRNILEKLIVSLHIPASPKSIRLKRSENKMKISLPYTETFFFEWQGKKYPVHTFVFNPEVESNY